MMKFKKRVRPLILINIKFIIIVVLQYAYMRHESQLVLCNLYHVITLLLLFAVFLCLILFR